MVENLASIIITLFVFWLGASVGSFLNVVVYRLPAGISLVHPPSRCPHCLHRLGKTENIPILGWIRLGGRCRWCKASISYRYPLVEAITALMFVSVYNTFGISIYMVGYFVLLGWLLALALIDLDTMILPNSLTQSGLVLGLVFQGFLGLQQAQLVGVSNNLMEGIGGAVLGIWLFETILIVGSILLGQLAMGGGDPKLAAMIGAWLGWKYVLLTGFVACFLGAVVGGGALALKWLEREQPIPFGPFLALAAIISVFWGDAFIASYMEMFFPFL